MHKPQRIITIGLLVGFLASTTQAQTTSRTEYQTIGFEPVATGLEHPWSLAFLPDGSMLVTERRGRLNHITPEGEVTPVPNAPEVSAVNQGGLLEVLPHPNFEDNRIVYLTYSKQDPEGSNNTATALARGFLVNGELVAVEDIFVQNRYSQPGRHYGSKLAWMPDGTLLMSIGQ
jgi:glucose/arabinose dehydrogenase